MATCVRTMVAAALGVSLLVGCSDKSSPGNNSTGGGGRDASAPDGSAQPPRPDAAIEPDAAIDPLTRDCTLASEHYEDVISTLAHQAFGLDVDANTGHLLYGAAGCASEAGAGGAILSAVVLPTSGAAGKPAALGAGACLEQRELAVIASSGGIWGYSVESRPEGDRLVATDLSGKAPEKPVALLDQAGRSSAALGGGLLGGHAVVAWAHGTSRDGATEVSLFFDGVSTSRRLFLEESAGQRVIAVAIGSLGPGKERSAPSVIAWVDATPGSGAIRTQLIDARGVAMGEPLVLSDKVGAGNRVAFVDQQTGGGLVFSDGSGAGMRTRFVSFNEQGKLATDPVSITNLDQNARDVAIARYGAGYAVVYRVVPDDPKQEARIRVAFTDELGNIAGTRDVAPALREAGFVRAVLARDGRLFVAWIDRDAKGVATLRVVRAECR